LFVVTLNRKYHLNQYLLFN